MVYSTSEQGIMATGSRHGLRSRELRAHISTTRTKQRERTGKEISKLLKPPSRGILPPTNSAPSGNQVFKYTT